MISKAQWSWIGACAIGTSHAREEAPCDDAGACIEVRTPTGSALVAVVSDGAGSAKLSRYGSAIIARGFCQAVATFLRAGGSVSAVDEARARDWLDEIRDRINGRANVLGDMPRSFAATMVGAIIADDAAVVIHVGDGACACRIEGETEWRVPSWPAQGEYAATTYFVTDDPEPRVNVVALDGRIEEVAVFTDGMERLALDFGARVAFGRFFESMFPALRRTSEGRQRRLSMDLRNFLDSPQVTDRTEDDKTLVLARRIPRGVAASSATARID